MYFAIEATAGELNDPLMGSAVVGSKEPGVVSGDCFMLKYDLDVAMDDIEQISMVEAFRNIRIQRQINQTKIISKEYFHVDSLKFEPSEDDPWCELVPQQILGAEYTRFETYMGHSKNIHVYSGDEIEAVRPHLFAAWDTWIFGKYHASYKAGNFFR